MPDQNEERRRGSDSPLTRPRYAALCGGAITALSIIVFGAFSGVNTFALFMPMIAAVGFSISIHYLLASFTDRKERRSSS